jgi:hypothetical protein
MKVLLTGLGPISNKIHSHKAAQAIIYADQLKQAGYDVDINLVTDKIYDYKQYDEVYVYHGSDWSGNLNLFGGIQAYPNVESVRSLSKYHGTVKSILIDFPDYAGMFHDRLVKADIIWDNINFDNLWGMTSAEVIDPNTVKRYRNIAFGDSHAISMYRPGWENVSVPFSTLHGSINRGFETFVPDGGEYDSIETYFGNIDIRHHLCRFDDPIAEAKKLAKRYDDEVDRISNKYGAKVKVWEPLPIENESRKVPKTGWYKGTPFYGTWQQRTDVRNAFIEALTCDVFCWTENLKNSTGELDFDYMEKPQSIHLSRASYPHWTGKEWTDPVTNSLDEFFG